LVVLLMGGIAASFMSAGTQVAQPAFQTTLLLAPLQVLALLPVYALWALPTVGWLLMVSAWARSKPFLWAVGVPLGGGVLLGWLNRMLHLDWNLHWYWVDVVGRGLVSTVPGTWFVKNLSAGGMPPPTNTTDLLAQSWAMLAAPQIWLGVLAGAAMVAVAIRLRRWREED
jgi:ABC-2 type transport system permease protein